jgi:hypothetical protein
MIPEPISAGLSYFITHLFLGRAIAWAESGLVGVSAQIHAI